MTKRGSPALEQNNASGGVTLGRERFAKISAVEGIKLTPSMKKRAAEFDRHGLPASERRRLIISAHRKG